MDQEKAEKIKADNEKRGTIIKNERLKKMKNAKKNFTQEVIAERLNISYKNYQKLENNGQGLDSIFTLKQLSGILDIPLYRLIDFDIDYNKPFIDQYRINGNAFDLKTLIEINKITNELMEKWLKKDR